MKLNRLFAAVAIATATGLAAGPALEAQEQPAGPGPAAAPHGLMGVAHDRGFQEWSGGVQAAGLQERIDQTPHTAFIAEDAAYLQVPATQRDAWRTDPAAHRAAVGHTLVEGRLTLDDLRQREYVRTIDGERIPVRVEGDVVFLGDARIREADIEAGQGTIHVVDRVTWPTVTVEPAPVPQPQPETPPVQPVMEPVRKN